MTFPALILGVLISTLLGAIFHFWRGGGAGRFLLYLFLAWIGFWLGHFLADYWALSIDKVGQLHIGFATLGSIISLGLGYWLSLVEVEKNS